MTTLPPDRAHGSDADPVWRVRLLGGLELDDGRQRITRLPSRAIAALLARLAIAPHRAHPREELIELLWPGVALDVGRNRLRQALSTLRSVLEPPANRRCVLLADRTQLRVAPGALFCDAVQFEHDVRAGRADAARAWYRGELLPGFYDDWIDEERLRLAAMHEQLTPPRAAAGAVAMPAAGAVDPPSAPAAPARPGARVDLPSYLTRMFGADAQAAALRAQVLAHRLVTVVGAGGAGKTRLAVEVAHSLRAHGGWPTATQDPPEPFDLIAMVALGDCHTAAQTVDAIAAALRVMPAATAPRQALLDALADRRTLLVLDNFEQLVGQAEDLVAQLVARLPRLHAVVTSRRALGVQGEHEFALAALPLPAPDAGLEAVAANPAVALFVERARAVRGDFHLGARNAAVLAALARELEGMPLAIELAAARVRSLAPADMLARLRQEGTPRLDMLARRGTRAAADARHLSMQRVVAWSWALLDDRQAHLLAALTVFAGSFTASAAQALAAASAGAGGGPADTALLLDDLVAHSLVQAHADGDAMRFRIYQPVREFALTQQDGEARAQARAGLRRWALHWAAALPATPPLAELRTEMPNLLACLASAAADGAPAEGIGLLAALRRALEDVDLPAEGLAHARALVEACPDPALQARGCTLLGPLLLTAGQREAALELAERGVRRDLLQGEALARALHALARVRWRSLRRADAVLPLLAEAEALAVESHCIDVQAGVLALRAFVANLARRDYAAGEQLHARALALWEQLGNGHAMASGLYNLAICALHGKRPRDALARLDRILAEAARQGDERRATQAHNVRGLAHAALRDWAAARADYQASIRLAWSRGAAWDLLHTLWNLPRCLVHLGQAQEAAALAAFGERCWTTRFGDLDADDRFELRRVRRLCLARMDRAAFERARHGATGWSLAEAVAVALDERVAG